MSRAAVVRTTGIVAASITASGGRQQQHRTQPEGPCWRGRLRLSSARAGAASRFKASLPFLPTHAPVQASTLYDVEEKSISELSADLARASVSSYELVEAYLQRIDSMDRVGPKLCSVLRLNPEALRDAQRLDAERAAGKVRGPLHGIPIFVKDNIEVAGSMPTTAGSFALAENISGHDAPCIAKLRDAGVVILGKTNMSAWANLRSSHSSSGWSAVGGLTRNAYALDRSAIGSSSGNGPAVSASLAVAAIGTETDGSITAPAAAAALVGLKPTVGLVSRRCVVPIAESQDTPGPMARTVEDTAQILTAMTGTDPQDPATAEADSRRTDYVAALDAQALKGARVGVARFVCQDWDFAVKEVFEKALDHMREAGAELVEIASFGDEEALGAMGNDEMTVLLCELKAGLNAYLAKTPSGVKTRSLAEVIAYNEREAGREMPYFGQELFIKAEETKGLETEGYAEARDKNRRRAREEGLDRLMKEHGVDVLVAPTMSAPFMVDLVHGDQFGGAATMLPAVAGYPHLTVPMGQVHGLPVGLSLMGPAWSEARLLSLGFAFERLASARRKPTFAASLPVA